MIFVPFRLALQRQRRRKRRKAGFVICLEQSPVVKKTGDCSSLKKVFLKGIFYCFRIIYQE